MLHALGHVVVEDRDALVHGVFTLPGRGLHFLVAAAHDDLHVLAAHAPGRAAAVHGGVAASQHDDARRHAGDVAKGDRGQPVDSDVDMGRRLGTSRHIEFAPTRCATANEDGVVALLHQPFERVHPLPALEVDAHVQDVAGLLVDHRLGQAKARNLRAHEAAGLGLTVEHRHLVTQRRQIAGHCQRGRAGTDAGNALAVGRGNRGHARADIVLVVGRHALEAADGDRFGLLAVVFFDAPAPTRRLARAVAGASEYAGKDVGHPVDEVSIAKATLTHQTYVFGNGCVGRTCPLAINDFVKVRRIGGIGRLQVASWTWN